MLGPWQKHPCEAALHGPLTIDRPARRCPLEATSVQNEADEGGHGNVEAEHGETEKPWVLNRQGVRRSTGP